ncbi:MAG: hypothetical protein K2K55_09610 [Duncaniella sp.]|nr:hypothetical protein [Duncaniella sp.]
MDVIVNPPRGQWDNLISTRRRLVGDDDDRGEAARWMISTMLSNGEGVNVVTTDAMIALEIGGELEEALNRLNSDERSKMMPLLSKTRIIVLSDPVEREEFLQKDPAQ